VRMIETSKNRWELQGPKGNTISENIPVNSKIEAEEWVKAYISSYSNWQYEIISKEGT
jgi:hypothetical protein